MIKSPMPLLGVLLLAGGQVSCAPDAAESRPDGQTPVAVPREVLLEEVVREWKDPAALNREKDTVVGPGPHSYLLMHLLQMRAAGWNDIDLDEVTALSGASALFAYRHGTFMPKYAFRHVAPDARIAEATGFGYEWVEFQTAEEAWRIVTESLDSGRPVKGEYAENVLFVGYRSAEDPNDRGIFAMACEPDAFTTWWTWEDFGTWLTWADRHKMRRLGRHARRTRPAAARETALRVVEDLVAWSAEPPEACRRASPKAAFGLAGLRAYAADVANIQEYPDKGMCHEMNSQWPTRKCSAVYLERLAGRGLFGKEANAHLLAASASYRKAFGCWCDVHRQIGWAAPEGAGKVEKRRRAAGEALRQAADHEDGAIEHLRGALAAVREEAARTRAYPKSAMLANVPGGKSHWNAFAGGLAIVLNRSGIEADYDTVMGDLGQAFLLQASDQVPRYDGALDAGWWPLAPDCLPVLVERAAPALGADFRWYRGSEASYRTDPAKHYRRNLEQAVKASIAAGRPCLENHGFWEVVVGYDDRPHPVFSFCPSPRDGQQKIARLRKYPFAVVTLAGPRPPVDRKAADVQALRRAVALARDEIVMPKGFRTGGKAFQLWAKCLRDLEHPGKHFWHTNVVVNLRVNRSSAVRYLRAMAGRHPAATADHLNAAADRYEEALAELKKADTGKSALASRPGREKLARLVERIAHVEKRAVDEIDAALQWADEAPGQVRPASLVRLRLRQVKLPKGIWKAHLPAAMVQALEHNHIATSYSELVAANGWAFSFSYKYGNWHVAALPLEDFTWYPEQLGCRVESVACRDPDVLWKFVRRHTDAGTPIVSTRGDGGLVYGHRVKDGRRQYWFDGCPVWGWTDVGAPHRFDTCAVLVKGRTARPRKQVLLEALRRAVRLASPHERKGVPRGLAALEAYLADVSDPTKSFDELSEWFCWATFERLSARRCCAEWLRSAAGILGGQARGPLLAAADHYEEAFQAYHTYDEIVHAEEGTGLSLKQRVRTPKRIATFRRLLRQGIEAEREGIEQMKKALTAAGRDGMARLAGLFVGRG